MTNSNNRINGLKKIISVLEWDIPHIKNKDLRLRKEEEIKQYKKEIEKLANEEHIIN